MADTETIRDAGALIERLRAQLAAAEAGRAILAGALTELCETAETAAAAISPETAFGQVSIVALREVAADGRAALHQVCGVES